MKLIRSIIIVLPMLVSMAQANETDQNEIFPIEYFVKGSDFLDMVISPSGDYYAARMRDDNGISLLIYRASDFKVISSVVPQENDEVRRVEWVNNERLVYSLAEKRAYRDKATPTGELFGINFDGSKHEYLAGYRAHLVSDNQILGTRKIESVAGKEFRRDYVVPSNSVLGSKAYGLASYYLLNRLPKDEKHVLVLGYPWPKGETERFNDMRRPPVVSKLNVYSGRTKSKEKIPFKKARVFANNDGEINFVTWSDEEGNLKASYRTAKGEPWRDVDEGLSSELSGLHAVGINTNGTKVYFKGKTVGFSASSIYEYDLSSDSLTRLFENELDIIYWETNHKNEPTVAMSYPTGVKYHFAVNQTDSPEVAQFKSLIKQSPGSTIRELSKTDDGSKSVLEMRDFINPGEYFLLDKKAKKMDFFAANRSWIDPNQLVKGRLVQLQARDGLQLNGYLTVPHFASSKHPVPLVVRPHPGPHKLRDYPLYNEEVQLLANRGYAVLQVNYRGSGGYTESFKESGYGQWGATMVNDIIDATNWATAFSAIDEKRVCIYGSQYGGFAAMSAASKAPDLYQCAIGSFGIYDLPALLRKGQATDYYGSEDYLASVLGNDQEALKEQSPVNHVDKIKAAVLLIHGEDKSLAPYKQFKSMHTAFRSAQKPVQKLKLNNAKYYAGSVENKKKVAENVLDFLDTHIGNK